MPHPLTIYRRKHGLTLEAFGARIDATKGMVSKWEASAVLPRPKTLQRIQDATGGEVGPGEMLSAFCCVPAEAAE